jgi:hypothetical protein
LSVLVHQSRVEDVSRFDVFGPGEARKSGLSQSRAMDFTTTPPVDLRPFSSRQSLQSVHESQERTSQSGSPQISAPRSRQGRGTDHRTKLRLIEQKTAEARAKDQVLNESHSHTLRRITATIGEGICSERPQDLIVSPKTSKNSNLESNCLSLEDHQVSSAISEGANDFSTQLFGESNRLSQQSCASKYPDSPKVYGNGKKGLVAVDGEGQSVEVHELPAREDVGKVCFPVGVRSTTERNYEALVKQLHHLQANEKTQRQEKERALARIERTTTEMAFFHSQSSPEKQGLPSDTSTISAAEEQLEVLNRLYICLKNTFSEEVKENRKLRSELEKASGAYAMMESQIEKSMETIDAQNQVINELTDSSARIQIELDFERITQGADNKYQAAVSELAEAVEQVAKKDEKTNKLQAELVKKQALINEITEQRENLERNVAKNQAQFNKLFMGNNIAAFEKLTADHKKIISEMKFALEQLADSNKANQKLKDQLNEKAKQVASKQTELSENGIVLGEKQASIDRLVAKVLQVSDEKRELQQQIKDLEGRISSPLKAAGSRLSQIGSDTMSMLSRKASTKGNGDYPKL